MRRRPVESDGELGEDLEQFDGRIGVTVHAMHLVSAPCS
jgi:hypothetical protein